MPPITSTKFYMLYAQNGSIPTIQHKTYDEALKEAKRLTDALNKPIFILEAHQVISKTHYVITDLNA